MMTLKYIGIDIEKKSGPTNCSFLLFLSRFCTSIKSLATSNKTNAKLVINPAVTGAAPPTSTLRQW